ncbi:uncharacterized protein LOC121963287, partial [Plectropomus leopardus]|uniref:uncharacterized protein LOC121963287 n=1 Tax=Plectropomus leopardus TaxID=160734 RepID=UPI001C4B4653
MTFTVFALYLTCLLWGEMDCGFVSVNTGDKLTLLCFYESAVAPRIYWIKETLGQKPRLISSFSKYNVKKTFHNEFKNNSRFTLDTEDGNNHLTITDLQISDSAMYHCIKYVYTLEFSESTTVSVRNPGLSAQVLVHQSTSEPIQPGGSVTLNCTVHNASCDGEHSVYWFKYYKDSHPGLIYSHGGRNDQCERNTNTQTHTCFYNLPMKSLNLSHAGTYYCAVASCGHILFGGGTKLDFEHELDLLLLVYFLSGALAFTTILVALLAFSVCTMKKKNSYSESKARFSAPSTADAEGDQDAESLHYAALSVNLPKRSRRQRNGTNDECVYSS